MIMQKSDIIHMITLFLQNSIFFYGLFKTFITITIVVM